MTCLAAKPSVDGLEHELENEAVFLRIDIGSELGGQVARLYGVRWTPTFIVFDHDGDIAYYKGGGFPDTDAIRLAVRTSKEIGLP